MKLSRLMVLDLEEIEEIIKNGYIVFSSKTCWSGENSQQAVDLSDFDGLTVVVSYDNAIENDFRRPTKEEIENDAFDWKELDEYRSKREMKLYIDDIEWIREQIEDGIDCWLETQDQGAIEFDLI